MEMQQWHHAICNYMYAQCKVASIDFLGSQNLMALRTKLTDRTEFYVLLITKNKLLKVCDRGRAKCQRIHMGRVALI